MIARMLSPRRLIIGLVLVLGVLAAGYSAWLGWQVRGDLHDARAAAERLRVSIREQDAAGREAASSELREAASRAADRTDGAWWSAMTRVPVVGDDAAAVRALSGSLDTVGAEALPPIGRILDLLPRVSGGGRIDLEVTEQLVGPVTQAHRALRTAHDEVSGVESQDLAGSVRGEFEEYVEAVADAESGLASSVTATRVLPSMLGGQEPRQYLLVFQNNAEIRATGGLPGSWALVEADQGDLEMTLQGTGAGFETLEEPVLPLSDAERKVYGRQLGTYFLDANFTPDFPRAAELWTARWRMDHPGTSLDGVISLDPVALSYLLEGTGPVEATGTTLTAGNLSQELLSRPYRELDPVAQDRLFAETARAIFDAISADLASPVDFVQGLSRAADEGRFRVTAFAEAEAEQLAGTRVVGALAGEDGATPHVDVSLNDATGSKMSYYLRYYGNVEAHGCEDGVQSLAGSMTLRQSISPQQAAELPDSVTGTGQYGTEQGAQLVLVRLHAPYQGSIGEITLNGKRIDRQVQVVDLDGRPTATVVVLLASTDEIVVRWNMETGPGQTGDGKLEMTPSVVPGRNTWSFASAC